MYPKSPKTRSRSIFFFSIGLKILQNIISRTVLQKCFFLFEKVHVILRGGAVEAMQKFSETLN